MSKKSTKEADWRELGRLLKLVQDTLSTAGVACHRVLPLPFAEKIERIEKQLRKARSDCENEMFRRTSLDDLKIFYPGSD